LTELIPLPTPNGIIEKLEECRRRYGWCWLGLDPLQKGHAINKVASILNRCWGDTIRPYLLGKPWRNPMKFLQDILGDESKREYRAFSQWMLGGLDTKSFIEYIAFIVTSYLKAR